MGHYDDDDDYNQQPASKLLQWATWVIRTRAFTTFRRVAPQEEEEGGSDPNSQHRQQLARIKKRCHLLPLLDFVNHANPIQANVALEVLETPDDVESSMFALRAIQDIDAGKELTMTYGAGLETSLDLVDKYGFWIDTNQTFKETTHEIVECVHSNDDRLDWSLFEPHWKESVYQTALLRDTESRPEGKEKANINPKPLSRAKQLSFHLSLVYLKSVGFHDNGSICLP